VPIPDLDIDNDGNIWMLNLGARNPNLVMAVFDPDDSLWQGYYENGQQVPDNYQFVLYIHGDTTYVASLAPNIERLEFNDPMDSTDDVWLSTLTGAEEVHHLLVDNYGKLFVASTSGLSYYDFISSDPITLELPDGYRSSVNCITMDGLGNKWVGTDSGVVVLSSYVDQYMSADDLWKTKFKESNSYLLDNSVLSIEIDRSNGLVYIGTTQGLSVYESGFIEPSPDLNDMAAYPNPVNAKAEDARVNFLKVPADAEIYIYTVAGDLVKKITYENTTYWDLKNESGRKVAAGVYIFYVRSGSNSGSGKIAVIR
jgi:ligand-binding sensor domain-containing protein